MASRGQLGSAPHLPRSSCRIHETLQSGTQACGVVPTEARPERIPRSVHHPHPHGPHSLQCWRGASVMRPLCLCSSPQLLGHRRCVITLYHFLGNGFLSLSETLPILFWALFFGHLPIPQSPTPPSPSLFIPSLGG